ncbi:hypothetical protein ACSHWG_00775 [Leucobacter sp. Z1108]|uniref:hypothetical protein n=1 Tax=Leucobacter sp. Z1108 TaxID=3439066 RepID=UPI003F4059CD
MTGWAGSTRKETLPRYWAKTRARVLRRDGRRCVAIREDTGKRCESPANQCDHIDDRDDHRMENLQSLCEWHHLQKSGAQGGAAAALKRKKAQKQIHPGII